jgi:hypothetical protein
MNPPYNGDPASLESFWGAEVTPDMKHACWKRYICFYNSRDDSGRFKGAVDGGLGGPSETLLLYILCCISIG